MKYKLRKGDIELETDDKDLVLRILGFKEEKAILPKVIPTKKEEIKETETGFYLEDGRVVSKPCVEEVFKAIIDSEKPYLLRDDLKPLMEKYNQTYINRALKVLELKGLIQKLRLGRRVAYKVAEKISEELKSQQKVIQEGLK